MKAAGWTNVVNGGGYATDKPTLDKYCPTSLKKKCAKVKSGGDAL